MSAPQKLGRGLWRGVYSAIVDHPDFHVLSPNARLTLLICRVGSANNQASIFRYYREPLAAQTGLTLEALDAALAELETKPTRATAWIIRDDVVLWVRNGLRYDPNLTPEAHSGHRESVLRVVAALPNTAVVKKFRRYYKLGGATSPPYHRATPPPTTQGGGDSIPTPTPKGKERTPIPKGSDVHVNVSEPNGSGAAQPDPEIVITPDEERGLPLIAQARRITLAQARSELLTAKLREREGRRP